MDFKGKPQIIVSKLEQPKNRRTARLEQSGAEKMGFTTVHFGRV